MLNERYRKPKGQGRRDNPETHRQHWSQDTERKQPNQKHNTLK